MLHNGREIAPSVSWDILLHVKRSGGMSVNELAGALKMSYMGVKQHCDDLKKRGYVDTWRRPKQTGRPEKIYRPTEKLDVVLPSWGGELCLGLLSLVSQAYGETVPERLLYGFLQQKVEQWNARMKGTGHKERAVELAKLRSNDGWLCQCVDDVGGLRIVDHHSPLAEVARLFPAVWDMEVRVLSRIFGHTLQRRTNGPHVEFVIIEGVPQPEPVPAAKAGTSSKAGKGTKSKKAVAAAAAVASEAAETPPPSPEPEPTPAPGSESAPEPVEAAAPEPAPEPAPVFLPEPEEESLSEAVPVTDVPVFEEETDASAPMVADASQAPVFESESFPEESAKPADLESEQPPVEKPVVPALEKPKRVTKSTKQTVKAGAERDLFDF